MQKLIITTVGTSILDKCCKKFGDAETIAEKLEKKGKDSEYYNEIKQHAIDALQYHFERYTNNTSITVRKRMSAEIASLLAMEKDIENLTNEDKIVLLHSDTTGGELCAEVTADVLCKERQICPEIIRIEGLQTENAKTFVDKGLKNLFTITKDLLEAHNCQRFVNITGGYKGCIPIQALQAQDKRVTVIYLFEDTDLVLMYFTEDGKVEFGIGNERSTTKFDTNSRHEYES